ncbi:MAG: TasA family protein [Saccharofermentanales bacterium]
MKTKLLMSVFLLIIAVSIVAGGSFAYFSDSETSFDNTFTAGTLDLKINDGDDNVVAFNVTNMRSGNQPATSYHLRNSGSITGYLNITSVVVVNDENGIIEPEASAGDVTDILGELGDVVHIDLYFDNDASGWWSTGDVRIYQGYVSDMPANFIVNEAMAPSAVERIVARLDWWDTANDNLAQGDTMTIDFTFNLSQNMLS